jgi:uncharacterized protein (DUF433 family)/predicted XRE-type DNA-binding protein
VVSDQRRVTAGSGNVYADLGFADPDLARQIVRILDERKLTQVQAAAILGIDQPKVAALVNGRLGLFSTERLMRFLILLERDVAIAVSTHQSGRTSARIAVARDGSRRVDGSPPSERRRAGERDGSVIRRDHEIMGGMPVFAGTRLPVRNLIDSLKAGDDLDEFLDHFPSVNREIAVAALAEMALATIGLFHER